jgi:hypothetical protein
VRGASRRGALSFEQMSEGTDDGLLEWLVTSDESGLARALRERRLFKRALDLSATDVPAETQPWLERDPDLVERVEDAVAPALGLEPGELLLDFPANPSMLSVDLPLRTRGGRIERLTNEGRSGQFGLPRVADELYRSARRFRVFTARQPSRSVERLLSVITLPATEVERRLKEGIQLPTP